MKLHLLDILRCPATGQSLKLKVTDEVQGDIASGELVTADGIKRYPIENFIPRFVSLDNYAQGFGFQWNKFRKTQMDSYTGVPLSRDRFFESSGWTPSVLKGKRVLDTGCGAGRFTEIALDAGAFVVALDYSSAVDACWANHGSSPNLNVIQGDICHLPFVPESFDFVYCLGVLQHTPNVKESFMALTKQLCPGGRLVVDAYPDLWLNILWPKYWLRPITKRVPQQFLFSIVEMMVSGLLPISLAIGRIPKLGRRLRYAIPVCNYEGIFPLSKSQLREWAVLDTFDMLAPMYDQPQTLSTLRAWFDEAGMAATEVFRRGSYVARGMKPRA
jgi:2-polyprenyl-3-methyl-5-hydroxy-6-metoxy-1,4-benzoquinol methylase